MLGHTPARLDHLALCDVGKSANQHIFLPVVQAADRENRIAIVLIAVFYFFNISFNCCHIFMLSVFRRFSLIVVFLLTVCELDKLTRSDRNCGQRILCDHRGNASFLLDQGIQTA